MENLVENKILEFYRGKKVFITGHTGFKGSWLTFLLKLAGAEVMGFSKEPNTNPNLFSELLHHSNIKSIIHDVCDFEKLQKEILKFNPDFIFHLAAQPLVRYSYQNSLETYNTNIMGTANILESCKKLSNECVVVCVTTDKVYHNFEWEYPYRETDKLGGYDPYSASKAAAELLIESYRNSFFANTGISISSVRAGNVIGGGDWSLDRLVPDVVRAVASGQPVILRNPGATRPWQHVLEPIFAYLLLGYHMHQKKDKYNASWNIGPYNQDVRSVLEVCETLINEFGRGEIQIDNGGFHHHEAGKLNLDISKFSTAFHWKPKWSAEQAIKITAAWYSSFINGTPAANLVMNDLSAYLKTD
jgi:CDP-glucose 4,6-dehydratase